LQKAQLKLSDIHDIPKYRELVPELKPEEYQELLESISEFGQRDPIIVNEQGVILDGHHRFAVCRDLSKEVRYEIRTFDNVFLEEIFVIDANLARRQLETYSRVTLLEHQSDLFSEIGKKNISDVVTNSNKARADPNFKEFIKVGPKIDTDKEIAERAKTSKQTATRVKYINNRLKNKGDKKTKRKLELGTYSINRVYTELKNEEKDDDLKSKIAKGEKLTEKELMYKLRLPVRPYDVWNYFKPDPRYGKEYPGQVPAGIIFQTLYFFTRIGNLVVDPMAGGGVVGDVCKIMNRKCLMYDLAPHKDRNDITKLDIGYGLPNECKNADLVFWDPPYYKKKESEYDNPGSISSLSKKGYLESFKEAAEDFRKKGVKKVALLMSDYNDYENESENIFIWDYVRIFENAGWKVVRHIHCDDSPTLIDATFIPKLIEARKLGRLTRSLIIFKNKDLGP